MALVAPISVTNSPIRGDELVDPASFNYLIIIGDLIGEVFGKRHVALIQVIQYILWNSSSNPDGMHH